MLQPFPTPLCDKPEEAQSNVARPLWQNPEVRVPVAILDRRIKRFPIARLPDAPASDHEITLCLVASSGFVCGRLCPAAQVLSVRLGTAMPWKRCPPPVSLSSRGAVHARRVVVHAQSCAWRLSQGLGALRCSTSAAAGRFRDAFFGAIAARRRQWEGKAQSLARWLCRGCAACTSTKPKIIEPSICADSEPKTETRKSV